MILIYQPNARRHVVVIIGDFFYHYDCHDDKLNKYPITYLVGRYENGKDIMYDI